MSSRRALWRSTAWVAFAALIFGCLALLWVDDRNSAILAVPTALYGLILAALTRWCIGRSRPAEAQATSATAPTVEEDDVLRQRGNRGSLRLRDGVVVASFVWCMLISVAFLGLSGGPSMPILTPWMRAVVSVHTIFRDGAQPFHALCTEIIIPGALMLLFGATLRQLGVASPVRGTGRALLACLALAIVMAASALFSGGTTFVALGVAILRSTMSGGFSEEFLARGVWLSQLRAYVSDGWALVISATMFALPHLGGTIAEEHGRVLVAIANVIALNAPIGVALGYLALRSRGLLLPGAVHTSLDVMARLTQSR